MLYFSSQCFQIDRLAAPAILAKWESVWLRSSWNRSFNIYVLEKHHKGKTLRNSLIFFPQITEKNPVWSATFGLPSSTSRPFSRTQILLLSITVCSLGDQSHMLLRGIPNFFSGSYLLLVLMYWEPVCNRKHWAFRKLISELQPMEMNANKNAVVHVIIMKLTMLLNHNFQ